MANFKIEKAWTVCHDCRGEGKTLAEGMRGHAYTSEELHFEGPDFLEDMRSGVYDVTCRTCNGRTTVKEITDRCYDKHDELMAKTGCPLNPEGEDEDEDGDPLCPICWARDEAEYRAVCAAERRMGA